MRMILFFDIPMETIVERRMYRRLIKGLTEEGFIMFQKSIYIKLSINSTNVLQTKRNISKVLPKDGNISLLTITEKQFASIDYLLGEHNSKVIDTEDRIIEI